MSEHKQRASLAGKSLDFRAPSLMKVGPNSELTMVFKVKPGHAEQLHEDLVKFGKNVESSDVPIKVGLHDTRLSIFENGTRLLFCTTFDGDMNMYLDDAVFLLFGILHPWFRHCEGYPGTMDAHAPDMEVAKQWFASHFCKSSTYGRIVPRTIGDIIKGIKVNDAFQKVLDNPKSHKLLEDPVFKPLLDLAAE